ncbi:MAG: DUF6636 domain-containing protein [Limnothrix sp. BL-A-16]|jgi:hypothetical protein
MDSLSRLSRWLIPAAVAGLSWGTVQVHPIQADSGIQGFVLPSGNIICGSWVDGGQGYLRCHVQSGLRPLPPQPADCNLDWGHEILLNANGQTEVLCVGDTIAGPYPRLNYNQVWERNGFRCEAKTTGLTCRARNGRGMFLSRERWRKI